MINVVDRVPTLAGRVKIIHADNSVEYVTLERADEPEVEGTPINKVLFDSIQTDVTNLTNSKLNISDKATQAEAIEGTNDTKYTTPLKVRQAINQKLVTRSYDIEVPTTNDLDLRVDLDSYINQNTILLVYESYINQFELSSSDNWMNWIVSSDNPVFGGWNNDSRALISTNIAIAGSRYKSHNKMIIDVKSKLVKIAKIGGILSSSGTVTSFDTFIGTYINNIGKIFPRYVHALSPNDFIKVRAYDSVEISNL